MAAVVSSLPPISFTEDIPDLIISEVSQTVYLSITISEVAVVTNAPFVPDAAGNITICTRQFVRNVAPLAKPQEHSVELPKLSVTIVTGTQTTTRECVLIPGGMATQPADMENWLRKNFLTWQPQVVSTTPGQPQWLAYVTPMLTGRVGIFSTLFAANGKTHTKTLITPEPPSEVYRLIDTSFTTLWADFCRQNDLAPLSYDVFGMVIPTITIPDKPVQPVRGLLPQRYVLCPEHIDDTIFGFVNTLGGFDTITASGKSTLKPEGENDTFTSREQETELANGYTSFWEKSTGYIETSRMASQFQDFLKSTSRWVYQSGQWLRIIMDEYKVDHLPRELNAYTFKFHLAAKNERRYFERAELPEPELPERYFEE